MGHAFEDAVASVSMTTPPSGVCVPAGSTVLMPFVRENLLRSFNIFANAAPLVKYDGIQEAGTGSDHSYNIGWIQTDVDLTGGQFYVDFTSSRDSPPIQATAIPFLDRFSMPWYTDNWGYTGDTNEPDSLGSVDILARYKDPCVLHLGDGKGWLMFVARNLVRQEVAITNGYPAAKTSTAPKSHSFPDNPGVSWPEDEAGTLLYPHSVETGYGPFVSDATSAGADGTTITYSVDDLSYVSARSEYLADIVVYWSKKAEFDDVVGPFWVRPSLVTAAAPDETGSDAPEVVGADGTVTLGKAHTESNPRYWYGVPGAVLVEDGEDEPMVYLYFLKDTCYHNHSDRIGSVGVIGTLDHRSLLTKSEAAYYDAVEEPAKLILKKMAVSDILALVSDAESDDVEGVSKVTDQSAWDEMADPLPALVAGEEYEVTVYDGRSVSWAVEVFKDSEDGVGLAGPMPALCPDGTLILFFVVAKDPRDDSMNGLWYAYEDRATDAGAERGKALVVGDSSQIISAYSPKPTLNYYDPDPVFVPSGAGTGTWYLYTGHGDPEVIWCLTAADSEVITS